MRAAVESKKALLGAYFKEAGYYSYKAKADEGEDPVARWIGREVKRFLSEADLRLPLLLRLAAAPAEIADAASAAEITNDAGEIELEFEDDEEEPTVDEVEAEEREEGTMMKHANYWDDFLAWVREISAPWTEDTDEYRERRAVAAFNTGARRRAAPRRPAALTRLWPRPLVTLRLRRAGTKFYRDLLELSPNLQTWVPHVIVYVFPRQIVELGEPARRSCDACESLGAVIKTIIKTLTCRRRINVMTLHQRSRNGKVTEWTQAFSRGYIQRTLERVSVRSQLSFGEENAPFLQRKDVSLLEKGRATKPDPAACRAIPARPIAAAVEAPTVPSRASAVLMDA